MNEQKKYEIIKSLADHQAANKQRAALTLGCTVRHINRMLKGYREHGKVYFIHGNRGRKPANTIPDETRSLQERGVAVHILNIGILDTGHVYDRQADDECPVGLCRI